jgi:hypothetical protein
LATDREAYIGFGYNTDDCVRGSAEKFQDLLVPDLKGKLAVTESTTSRAIGVMLKYKGDEFVREASCTPRK